MPCGLGTIIWRYMVEDIILFIGDKVGTVYELIKGPDWSLVLFGTQKQCRSNKRGASVKSITNSRVKFT